MDLKEKLNNILFNIGKDIKVHKIDNNNTVIEIDYDKYSDEILNLFKEYKDE